MEFKITKERILETAKLDKVSKDILQGLFPEAFKSELKVGKWYRDNNYPKHFAYITEISNDRYYYYGFNIAGTWQNKDYYYLNDRSLNLIEETTEELKQALIKEAKKRGFKNTSRLKMTGINSKFSFNDSFSTIGELNKSSFYIEDNILDSKEGHGYIFENGIWAEIIEEKPKRKLTVSQICEELGEEIEIVKE